MTITWQILDTKRKIEDGVVVEVTYNCVVNVGGEIDRKIGTIALGGDSTASNFIPFSNLTEEVLITWVKNTLGELGVTEIENTLIAKLEAQKAAKEAKTEINGLPWVN